MFNHNSTHMTLAEGKIRILGCYYVSPRRT